MRCPSERFERTRTVACTASLRGGCPVGAGRADRGSKGGGVHPERHRTPAAVGYVSELGPARARGQRASPRRWSAARLVRTRLPAPRVLPSDRRDGTLRWPLSGTGVTTIPWSVRPPGHHRARHFTAIARAAGPEVAGFTTQSEFLFACGLLDLLADVDPGSPEYVQLTAQIKRITLPGEMGEAIKVMALARGIEEPLIGFSGRDHRSRL